MPKIAVCDAGNDAQRVAKRIVERLSFNAAHPLTFVWGRRTGDDPDFDGNYLRVGAAEELAAADVALVIVCNESLAKLRADDWSRHQLELLHNSRRPIVLVIIDGTALPPADELPSWLRALKYLNAVSIRTDAAFDEDVDHLFRAIQFILDLPPRPVAPAPVAVAPPPRQPLPIAALMRKRKQAYTRVNQVGEIVMASVSHPHDMRPPQSATPAAQYEPSPRSSAPPAAKSNSLWLLTFGAAAALTAAGYIWRHELGIAVGGLLKMLGLASAPLLPSPKPTRALLDASAFAPAIGRVGDEVLVQIFLHAPAGVSAAASLAHEADPTAVRRGIATLAIEASHGQRIDVILEAGAIPIDEASQSLVWRGEPCSCQFILTLPSDQAGRTCAIKARILLDSVPAGALRFSLKITADTPTSALDLVGEAAHRYRQAFLSHSHTDRVKVLTYAQLLDAIGIRYFQDVASLRAMEHWEHRLHEAIDGCDLFLLFWTADAAHSEWVERETRYALERQRRSAEETPDIMPVFLEADTPQPPEWLKSRHFDSILRLAMRGAQAESEKRPS